MTELKKFEEKRKRSLMEAIWTRFWLGLEELMRVVGVAWSKSDDIKWKWNHIWMDLDKYENGVIKKRKN